MLDTISQPITSPAYCARHVRTLGELFDKRVEIDGRRVAMRHRQAGAWRDITWNEFHERAAAMASFLMDRGIEPGDKICIIGSTCAEWCYADMAGQLAGAVTLGAYPTLAAGQLAYILDHSDSRIALVEGRAEVEKLMSVRGQVPRLELVCVWDTRGIEDQVAASDWLVALADVLAHPLDQARTRARIEERRARIDPSSTAIIVYTSGTTGPPKGAMLSHRNILTLLADLETLNDLDRNDVMVSFLPMAHAAERVVSFYVRLNGGMVTCFASSPATVLDDIRSAQPTVFGAVPRIFEKAYDRIQSQVQSAPSARRAIFRAAERVGREVVKRWQRGERIPRHLAIPYRLADRLVFSKIRSIFGGQVRYFVTGAAPIPREVLEFFWAAGCRVFEAYGQTEATAVSHINRSGQTRLGSVGRALPWVEERIAEDGEILVRGGCVFQGYYKDPEATAEAIDAEGWLHTGDIGKQDEDGYLYIVDRKKHIIITAGGKNITPSNIENEIKSADPMINQVHVHGDRRPYLTAIVTIGAVEAIEYGQAHGLVSRPDAERMLAALARDPLSRPADVAEAMRTVTGHEPLKARIADAVRRANGQLARVETIKKIHILEREFSMAEDEITPTLKTKRKNIEGKLADLLDRLYKDPAFGVDTGA